jgi:hypothetical protein
MKLNLTTALMLLGVSMFCGIIIISIGFGAAFPVIDRVAAPFVCAGRELELEQQTYSYRPGEVTTTVTWYCTNEQTGAREDVSLQTALVSGLIYGAVIFVVAVIWWLMANRPGQNPSRQDTPPSPKNAGSQGTLKKMMELKEMRDADLITEQEYEKKKAEILENL